MNIWNLNLRHLKAAAETARLGTISQEDGLADAIPLAERLLKGEVRGRVVVDVNR